MNAVFREQPIDPPEDGRVDWYDLRDELKASLLADAVQFHPKLLDIFYAEALSAGVDPIEFLE